MTAGRRAAACVVAGAVLAVAAGCGGSGRQAAATTTTTATTPAGQRAEIKRVWERFFAGSTPASEKVALLENGSAFAKAIEAQASSPLAKSSSATVTRVTLTGPATATVLYTIDLSGKPALTDQQGTAVKADGAWKVSQASFCPLLSLQGTAPPACSQGG